MDEQDLFRRLGFGLKFNTERFTEDARKLHVLPENKSDVLDSSRLDFFRSDCSVIEKCIRPPRMVEGEEQDSTSPQQLRKKHKIFVEGSDIPDLFTSFSQLEEEYGLDSDVGQAIKNNMKFALPTPIQMQAVTVMMHRRELLACAPTGSGKTLAFLIPVIAHMTGKSITTESKATGKKKRGFRSLILSPTRELAMQTLMVCKQLVTPCLQPLESDTSMPQPILNVKILDKAAVKCFHSRGSKYGKRFDIIISTPNRLVHLLQADPPLIDLSYVEWFIMDESDKLFEGGEKNSFREQLGIIYSACTSPAIRRALFSATFAFDVEQWCHLNMDNVIKINIGGKNTAVKSVKQSLLFTGNERGKLIALRDIFRLGLKPPVLVFVQSKERAKELFAELIYDGMNVDAIHADRTPLQRENAVKCFRSGITWILICTELLGRGMDFKGVNLVVNYDFPNSAVSYIHRVGRTGRAGRKGEAVTFFTENDRPLLRSIANVIKEAGCSIPQYMLKLKKIGKTERKTVAKHEVKRQTIRTAPKEVLKGSKRKNEGADNSIKQMKRNLTDQ